MWPGDINSVGALVLYTLTVLLAIFGFIFIPGFFWGIMYWLFGPRTGEPRNRDWSGDSD